MEHDNERFLIIRWADWTLISEWALTLEQRLTAACLAFGHSKETCRAE